MTEQPLLRAAEPSPVLRRRLVRVRILRLALPSLAGLLVLLLVGQLAWNALAATRQPAVAAADTSVRMVSPSFTGEGRDGSHYQVTASSGERDAKDEKRIHLQNPVVVVTRNGQVDTQSTSQTGIFQEDQRKLLLSGQVQVKNANGYNFTAQNALIDTATGQVAGQAIQGHGLAGDVRSNDYAAYDKGDRVIFKGGVRARLNDSK